jgi:hypothetical protein
MELAFSFCGVQEEWGARQTDEREAHRQSTRPRVLQDVVARELDRALLERPRRGRPISPLTLH